MDEDGCKRRIPNKLKKTEYLKHEETYPHVLLTLLREIQPVWNVRLINRNPYFPERNTDKMYFLTVEQVFRLPSSPSPLEE